MLADEYILTVLFAISFSPGLTFSIQLLYIYPAPVQAYGSRNIATSLKALDVGCYAKGTARLQTNMSTSFLKLIPTDPSFVPKAIAQEIAKGFLSQQYADSQIEFISNENIEFVDQGQNFESVSCNLCGHRLDIEYWQNAMDKSYESQFINLIFATPCCKKTTSLNDLTYKLPAGFARHVISISNPARELTKDDLVTLQGILKTDVRIIWAHY